MLFLTEPIKNIDKLVSKIPTNNKQVSLTIYIYIYIKFRKENKQVIVYYSSNDKQ